MGTMGMKHAVRGIWKRYLGLWRGLTGRRLFLFYVLHYTSTFLLLSLVIFEPFREAGVSFVCTTDGLPQHFVRLEYISHTLRSGLLALLKGEGWKIPLYDFSAGLMRQDLQIGFPQILAALVPWGSVDRFYTFYCLANYWMAGLSFSYFGFYYGKRPMPVLSGAVGYAFCAFALYAGVRHPHFIVPMIFLPLLTVGAEKVLRKERSFLLTAAVFLSLTTQTGLYFFCMQGVVVALFAFTRFFDLYREDRSRELVRFLGRLCAWGGTGVLLAGVVVIPSFLSVVGIGRIGGDVRNLSSLWHYGKAYYLNFLQDFAVSSDVTGYWALLGFAAPAVPAVALLFVRRNGGERCLRRTFLVLTAMLLVPAAGYVLSGFSNVSNRFCFAYAMCVSAIVTFMVPRFAEATREQLAAVTGLTAAWLAVSVVVLQADASRIDRTACVLLTLALLLCCAAAGRKGRRWIPRVMAALTALSVLCTADLRYAPGKGNYVSEFYSDPYGRLGQEPYAALASASAVREDPTFFRVASNTDSFPLDGNRAFYYGLKGVSAYPYFGWSTAYFDWIGEMEIPRDGSRSKISGLDTRSGLLSLANVKYFAVLNKNGIVFPSGFSEAETVRAGGVKYTILRNDDPLPAGYTYEKWMPREAYDRLLDPLAKESAQLQAVVLEEAPACLPEGAPSSSAYRVPWEIAKADGLRWENGALAVEKNGASLTIRCGAAPGERTYLRVVGLDLTDGMNEVSFWVTASTGATSASGYFYSDVKVYSNMQHTQLFDLGRSESGFGEIRLSVPRKGSYHLADLEVWCDPEEDRADQIAALGEEALEDVETDWRSLRGRITVTKDKFLCVAVPYMDGWTAYMDGRKAKLYRANTAFMGVELSAGTHTVELRYRLPGLTPGLALTGLGFVCLAVLLRAERKRRKAPRKQFLTETDESKEIVQYSTVKYS